MVFFNALVVSSIFSKDGFTGPNRKVWAFFLALFETSMIQGHDKKSHTR
jgi:hypothetical protein